jgi:hypothetical protein
MTEVTTISNFYVSERSVVREIWGKSDTILLIFAGAAAEFALNKAVDWLYFTGRLPSDPLGRLFSTVTYAQRIIFSSTTEANAAIDAMRSIHTSVERSRGFSIPDEAYRDVLFMLIWYSIRAFEVLERKLSRREKEEVVSVFVRVGKRMKIPGMPHDYSSWLSMYLQHNVSNLEKSAFTADLFRQYRKHLGWIRFIVLIQGQKLVVTKRVSALLGFNNILILRPLIPLYRFCRKTGADQVLKNMLLPNAYKQRISMLDRPAR